MGRFVKIPLHVLEREDLTAAAKLVYSVIVNRIGSNTTAWPGLGALAKAAGLHRNTVHRAVTELVNADLIAVEHRSGLRGARRERSNVYKMVTLNVTKKGTSPTSPKRVCHQNGDVDVTKKVTLNDSNVTKMVTDLDKGKEDPITRPKKKARARDPWTDAQAQMTGNTLRTDAFQAAWLSWVEYRRQAGKRLTAATIAKQVKRLESWGHDDAIRAIERSIENGWQGLFEPKEQKRDGKAVQANGRKQARSWSDRHPGEYAEDPGDAAFL